MKKKKTLAALEPICGCSKYPSYDNLHTLSNL